MTIRARVWFAILTGLLMLGLMGINAKDSQAQPGSVCTQLVQDALQAVGNNCQGLGRNSACYGYNRVNAVFNEEQVAEFFTQPADQAEIVTFQSISTAPLRVESAEWGIAVLNVQADLPNALPGEAATFLLLGDVTLENAVDPDTTAASVSSVPLTVVSATVMFTRPLLSANTSGSIPVDTELEADQVSADGNWARVVYEGRAGWVLIANTEINGDLSGLPTPDTAPYTPMQSVRLRTGLTGLSCEEAPPSLLVVQGPQQMTINLTINGANLNIGSTIVVWQTGPNQMAVAVIDGGVYTPDGKYLPAGFISFVVLDEAGNATGEWSEPRALTLEEWRLFEPLEGFPANLLHYPIEIPSELIETLEPTATPTPVPVVVPPPPTAPPQVIQVDCSSLLPTSPLDGLGFGGNTFYWNGIADPTITGYRVNVYRDGALAVSFQTAAPATSVFGDLSALPLGGAYTWEVQALTAAGVVVCTRGTNATIQRAFPAPDSPPQGTQDPSPGGICNRNQECEPGETFPTCPDCRGICGNGFCEPNFGEDPRTCPSDCP